MRSSRTIGEQCSKGLSWGSRGAYAGGRAGPAWHSRGQVDLVMRARVGFTWSSRGSQKHVVHPFPPPSPFFPPPPSVPLLPHPPSLPPSSSAILCFCV